MIRRLIRPQLPWELKEAGWRLRQWRGSFWCEHPPTLTVLRAWPSVGQAVDEAWRHAEPDHERLIKFTRERLSQRD